MLSTIVTTHSFCLRAERDLGMPKIKRKVSRYFRAVEYAHAYYRVSSYLQIAGNHGCNPLAAIQMAFVSNVLSSYD